MPQKLKVCRALLCLSALVLTTESARASFICDRILTPAKNMLFGRSSRADRWYDREAGRKRLFRDIDLGEQAESWELHLVPSALILKKEGAWQSRAYETGELLAQGELPVATPVRLSGNFFLYPQVESFSNQTWGGHRSIQHRFQFQAIRVSDGARKSSGTFFGDPRLESLGARDGRIFLEAVTGYQENDSFIRTIPRHSILGFNAETGAPFQSQPYHHSARLIPLEGPGFLFHSSHAYPQMGQALSALWVEKGQLHYLVLPSLKEKESLREGGSRFGEGALVVQSDQRLIYYPGVEAKRALTFPFNQSESLAAFAHDGDKLWVLGSQGRLFQLRKNGATEWSAGLRPVDPSLPPTDARLALSRGRLIIGAWGNLSVLDLKSGQLLRQVPLASAQDWRLEEDNLLYVDSSPQGPRLTRYKISTDEILWQQNLGSVPQHRLQFERPVVLTQTAKGVEVFHWRDGRRLFSLEEALHGPAELHQGIVYYRHGSGGRYLSARALHYRHRMLTVPDIVND